MTTAPSLLITDDDASLRETLQCVFEPLGFRTLLAADGEEAVEIVRSEPIHLVLLDMHMPKLTGIETVRLVHRLGKRIPFILMSAKLDDQIVAEARKEQVFSVLPKPVSRSQLTGVVRQALATAYGWAPDPVLSIHVRITTRSAGRRIPPAGETSASGPRPEDAAP